jgi:hypothetical protein
VRVSTDPKDAGYVPNARERFVVWQRGVIVPDWVIADDRLHHVVIERVRLRTSQVVGRIERDAKRGFVKIERKV